MVYDTGTSMSTSNKKSKMRVRHSSLEMPDPEVVVKKKQDMLTKARNKLLNLSEALKSSKNLDNNNKRTVTQATLDYLFKHSNPSSKEKNGNRVYANENASKRSSLQKQNSVGAYPIKIEIEDLDDEDNVLHSSRSMPKLRPATICGDKVNNTAAALALERPRKKLSFREPEILSSHNSMKSTHHHRPLTPELKRSTSGTNGILHRSSSFDDFDLESQAMRVVRTIGQAFEVCHKLSITAPEQENHEDEQDTFTQDLLSDRLSDIASDKQKKDDRSEAASDKISLPPDPDPTCYSKEYYPENNRKLEMIPPPITTNTRKSPLSSAETYASPHSDGLAAVIGGGGSLPPPGSALSAHHELQLMREQLEQQSQQTQAALAQLQLTREQLAAEQTARLEAQSRTHQLLVHNRELLDHIAALVAHLQGGDKSGQQQTPPHVTMPQHHHQVDNYDMSEPTSLDNSPVMLGLNPQGLIENRAVTSCLPPSPLRTAFNPPGGVFNFPYHHQQQPSVEQFDPQFFQRLQSSLATYPPSAYSAPMFNYPPNPYYNNNYNTLQQPQKNVQNPALRHSSLTGGSPGMERRSPNRHSEPRQTPQNPAQNLYQSQQNLLQYQHNHLQSLQTQNQQMSPKNSPNQERRGQFIKPLAQMSTLTTTDADGRVRVIVPVPATSSAEDTGNYLAHLRLSDDSRTVNGPPITRSTSEKVPNRSELMSQVQRTMWARHTTK